MFHDLEQRHVSGGDNIREVQSPTFQGENPRSGLNWLCLTVILFSDLVGDIVLRVRTIFRVKTQGLALIGCAWHCSS